MSLEINAILEFIRELAVLLIVFTLALSLALFRGRQYVVNVIIGLYLALLFITTFPFAITEEVLVSTAVFIICTICTTSIIARLMPEPFREKRFESLGKKLLLSAGVTVLVMIFSFHILPVQEFITIGSPISSVFGREDLFFWWLITPFILLYFHK